MQNKGLTITAVTLIIIAVGAVYMVYVLIDKNQEEVEDNTIFTTNSDLGINTISNTESNKDNGCVKFSDSLESCIAGYNCTFTHPITQELMKRRIIGIQNGLCITEEDMPNNGLLTCSFENDDLKKAIIQMYKDTAKGTYEANVEIDLATGIGENTYTINGITTDNPLQQATEMGVCVVSGY